MPSERPPAGISTFRGDFDELAIMMQESWAANHEQALLYSTEFLAKSFEYPGATLELAPAVYADNRVIAFAAGFPRSVSIQGRPARMLLNSFLTASADCKGTGYGLGVYRELIRRAQAAGYDGTIGYCVEGDDMNRMMPALANLFGLNTQRIYSIEYLTRFLRPAPVVPAQVVAEDEIEMFLELAGALPQHLPIRRAWIREEAVWQCRQRSGGVVASLVKDGRRGILTGYVMSVAGTPPTRVVLMEDLLWGDLDAAGQSELLQHFLRSAASRGAQTASCPLLGYASTEALTAVGFRASKRILHVYLTLWNSQQPAPVNALYIDVF